MDAALWCRAVGGACVTVSRNMANGDSAYTALWRYASDRFVNSVNGGIFGLVGSILGWVLGGLDVTNTIGIWIGAGGALWLLVKLHDRFGRRHPHGHNHALPADGAGGGGGGGDDDDDQQPPPQGPPPPPPALPFPPQLPQQQQQVFVYPANYRGEENQEEDDVVEVKPVPAAPVRAVSAPAVLSRRRLQPQRGRFQRPPSTLLDQIKEEEEAQRRRPVKSEFSHIV